MRNEHYFDQLNIFNVNLSGPYSCDIIGRVNLDISPPVRHTTRELPTPVQLRSRPSFSRTVQAAPIGQLGGNSAKCGGGVHGPTKNCPVDGSQESDEKISDAKIWMITNSNFLNP